MGKRSYSKEGRMRSMNKRDLSGARSGETSGGTDPIGPADTQIGKLKAQPVSFESVSESISDTDLWIESSDFTSCQIDSSGRVVGRPTLMRLSSSSADTVAAMLYLVEDRCVQQPKNSICWILARQTRRRSTKKSSQPKSNSSPCD